MSKNKNKYKLKKGFAIDQNSGGKKGFVRGKRKETSLSISKKSSWLQKYSRVNNCHFTDKNVF